MPDGVSIDIWHAALLMPIIWTFAGVFYAGWRCGRAVLKRDLSE